MDKEKMVHIHSGILFSCGKEQWAGGVAQVVEYLLCKHKALSCKKKKKARLRHIMFSLMQNINFIFKDSGK
jgi:hypothetical protein